jgi:hypothetical protein
MTTVTAKCTNITQARFGAVQFQVLTGKDKTPSLVVALQFNDPKEAAKFIHGEVYEINIKPKK